MVDRAPLLSGIFRKEPTRYQYDQFEGGEPPQDLEFDPKNE